MFPPLEDMNAEGYFLFQKSLYCTLCYSVIIVFIIVYYSLLWYIYGLGFVHLAELGNCRCCLLLLGLVTIDPDPCQAEQDVHVTDEAVLRREFDPQLT